MGGIALEEGSSGTASWGLFGTLLWSLVVVLILFMTQIMVMGMYIGMNYPDAGEAEVQRLMAELGTDDVVLSLATITSAIVCTIVTIGIIKLKKGSSLAHYLAIRGTDSRMALKWLLIIAAVVVALDTLTILLDRPFVPEVVSTVYESMRAPLLLAFVVIVVAPVFEEMFFRGFMVTGLANSAAGPAGAVVISSMLWSGIHLQYDFYEVGVIFVIGIVLGWARVQSGSVLLAIGLHALVNLVSTIEVILTARSVA